jgi:CheY-like chemotaxis protein
MADLFGAAPSPYVAIVRRGGVAMFVALDTCLADGGVDVVWDRRFAERRRRVEAVRADRRAQDRRGPPPSSWGWPGLVIVEAPPEAAPPPPTAVPRRRILVVEDDPRVREVLHQTLALAGYDVVVTADGEEAIAAYAAAPTDRIITDLMMPRKDGVETIRGLRRQHPAAKVIAVTAARGRFNRLTAARHLGAHRTLLKPFGMGDLLAAVHEVLAS